MAIEGMLGIVLGRFVIPVGVIPVGVRVPAGLSPTLAFPFNARNTGSARSKSFRNTTSNWNVCGVIVTLVPPTPTVVCPWASTRWFGLFGLPVGGKTPGCAPGVDAGGTVPPAGTERVVTPGFAVLTVALLALSPVVTVNSTGSVCSTFACRLPSKVWSSLVVMVPSAAG